MTVYSPIAKIFPSERKFVLKKLLPKDHVLPKSSAYKDVHKQEESVVRKGLVEFFKVANDAAGALSLGNFGVVRTLMDLFS